MVIKNSTLSGVHRRCANLHYRVLHHSCQGPSRSPVGCKALREQCSLLDTTEGGAGSLYASPLDARPTHFFHHTRLPSLRKKVVYKYPLSQAYCPPTPVLISQRTNTCCCIMYDLSYKWKLVNGSLGTPNI